MKRLLISLAVVGSLAAIPVSNVVWGKAHVPAHKEQACHKGETIAVGAKAIQAHLKHGDCFIDKRTRIPPLFTGDPCDCTNHR